MARGPKATETFAVGNAAGPGGSGRPMRPARYRLRTCISEPESSGPRLRGGCRTNRFRPTRLTEFLYGAKLH